VSARQENPVAEELPPNVDGSKSGLQVRVCPVFAGAFFAGANGSQEIEAEDTRRVAVVKINLQGLDGNGVIGRSSKTIVATRQRK
jgi:hypothetical protein